MTARIGFLGTPDVAVPALQAVVEHPDLEVEVVITNPDRRRGRGRSLAAPPVKEAALALGLPVWQPDRPADVRDELTALELDACAVVAYGALLPRAVLDVPRHGFVNLHFSLLPRWRGAAPVQHAIRAGDTVTGVSTFVLDEGMDTGPLLEQLEVPIDPEESAGDLLTRLAEQGAPVLARSLVALVEGMVPRAQPEQGATSAPKIVPEDVRIDVAASVAEVANLVRSADPAPGAHTTFRGDRLKVFRLAPVPDAGTGEPGEVLRVDKDGMIVALGDGAARLAAVQPMGKARMDGAAFVNGYRPVPGERLGEAS